MSVIKVRQKIKCLASVCLIIIFVLCATGCSKTHEEAKSTPKENIRKLQEYEKIGEESEGMLAVKRNGYWGYVETKNYDLVIDIMFDRCEPFKNGRAVVAINEKEGVIDKQGNYVLKTKYRDVEILDTPYIRCTLDNNGKELYDINGTPIISDDKHYTSIEVYQINGKTAIVAQAYVFVTIKTLQKREAAFIFDADGNMLVDGAKLEYTMIGEFKDGYAVVERIIKSFAYNQNRTNPLYNYINTTGGLLSKEWFLEARTFENGKGIIAVGEVAEDGYYSKEEADWKVIDTSGKIICDLPDQVVYERIFADYAVCHPIYESNTLFLVSLKDTTKRLGPYSEIEFFDYNCAIVTDYDTGLKGLIANNTFVLDTEYNSIIEVEPYIFEYQKGEKVDTINIKH